MALLLGLLVATAAQAELYRYVNSAGVTVLDRQGVPPEYVANGYEVLNDQGRVIRVVPRAPTAEELRQRAEAERQAQADAQLRQRYASLADLEQTRAQRLRDLDSFAGVNRANLRSVNGQLRGLERQAAERQRAGQNLTPALLRQIEDLREERRRLEGELQRLEHLRGEVETEFAADRARLEQLLDGG
ncbi:DUF4124 domain-containing protein [Pseudomonas stutzeri]|nr:DUF4124 domain-containing protein [Stutzerimonas stutzeri]